MSLKLPYWLNIVILINSTYWITGLSIDLFTYYNPKYKLQQKEKQEFKSALKYSLINTICVLPVISYALTSYIKYDSNNNNIILLMSYIILLDFCFYSLHKLVHKKINNNFISIDLYKNIHKIHHMFTAPYAITGFACHPLEFIFVNLLSVSIPPLFLGLFNINPSKFLLLAYFVIATLNTVITHSGIYYNNDINSVIHDNHHKLFNCNYGAGFYLSDILFRTYNNAK